MERKPRVVDSSYRIFTSGSGNVCTEPVLYVLQEEGEEHTMSKGTSAVMKWYVKACPNCHGDLHDDIQDQGWVACFMCARTYRLADVLRPAVVAAQSEIVRPQAEPDRRAPAATRRRAA